ncbi:EPIDERMAL PATTERNING FACTOR-like protein 2 [Silene latifolia]|uniref:EPIDERMAL PATTERNING FACTOR-like protein 2 n=1 Tax=Silene latifolia TaxID=37657 RepID=UPI003D7791E6
MVHLNINMIVSLLACSLFSICMFASTNEGRMLLKLTYVNNSAKSQKIIEEEKVMIIGRMIGSRPPRCQGRCYSSCGGRCVAVQVPTVSVSNLEYARGESSDYKPITWKCKCATPY